ncbi:MAG: uroporphyrinogen decarboxylase family protein [Planctomycetota bacterium]|nr:uroporphyrinogen decarboxylase family protein [Planctomycetota bacterium]
MSNNSGNSLTMTSRQRVLSALNYQQVDRVPVDLGGTLGTGAHVSVIANLRQALGLDVPGTPVKVVEPYQMLGEVAADLREMLSIDTVNLPGPRNHFGFADADFKPWKTFDGTNVLVAGKFNTEPEPNGDIFQYPQGDKSAPASGRMPRGGYYFDDIIRQGPIDEAKLDPADNLDDFAILSEEDLKLYEERARDLYDNTDLAITTGLPGTAFGDIALVPGAFLKHPKGIRDIEEWYISTVSRKEYIKEVFAGQTEVAIENLKLIHQAVGDRLCAVWLDGTDLAAQNTLFCGPDTYRELYLPYSRKLNDWIHAHTKWKTMKHCCGGCEPLIEGFIDAGFDILNPIQTSASGMDPELLVDKYGGRIVFWGGGADTQQTLPFGEPDQVRQQVAERVKIFNAKNGFVFSTVHNIQCKTPTENVVAMFESLGRNVNSKCKE